MSWEPMKLVLDAMLPKLTAAQKLTLIAMARFASKRGANIFPAVDTLAINVNVSRSQIHKILNALEKVGYISVVQRSRGGNFYATTERRLNLALIAEDDRAARAAAGRRPAAEVVEELPAATARPADDPWDIPSYLKH